MRTLAALIVSILLLPLVGLMTLAREASTVAATPPPASPDTRPAESTRSPLLASEDGKSIPGVRLATADLHAVVRGNLAQATMTLTFANDKPQVLGGNVTFPLPGGATVTGYGLDVNGNMVDGVAVEKERARIIYEQEIHKRVDPGLVEHVAGNAFRTRLYPIPANGTRSVKIEYVTQVEQGKDGPAVTLPMGFGDLDQMAVTFDTPEATAAPVVKTGGVEGLAFARGKEGFTATASAKHAKSGDELVVGLPELPDRSVAVEKRPRYARTVEELEERAKASPAGDKAGGFDAFEYYFTVTDRPAATPRKATDLPHGEADRPRIGVLWDASLSRGSSDHARELALLRKLCKKIGNVQVDLIVFRNDVEPARPFKIDGGNADALVEHLKGIAYDGTTNLGAVEATADPHGAAAAGRAYFLLSSPTAWATSARTSRTSWKSPSTPSRTTSR